MFGGESGSRTRGFTVLQTVALDLSAISPMSRYYYFTYLVSQLILEEFVASVAQLLPSLPFQQVQVQYR